MNKPTELDRVRQFERSWIAAIDAGLRELERQGAVKLPRYCDLCGAMDHPPSNSCRTCGLDANKARALTTDTTGD